MSHYVVDRRLKSAYLHDSQITFPKRVSKNNGHIPVGIVLICPVGETKIAGHFQPPLLYVVGDGQYDAGFAARK